MTEHASRQHNLSPCRSADNLRGADYCMATNARLLYADLAAPTHSGSRYRPPTLHGQRRSRSNISHINRGASAWRQAYFHQHGQRACKSSLPFTRCAPTHTSHSQNSPASTRIKIRPPTSLTEHFRILLLSVHQASSLPAGPLCVSILLEQRSEHVGSIPQRTAPSTC